MAKHQKKQTFGVRKPKKAQSPTGKPSKVRDEVKKMKAVGDVSGGTRPKKKAKAKAKTGFVPGTIPKVEKELKKAGA